MVLSSSGKRKTVKAAQVAAAQGSMAARVALDVLDILTGSAVHTINKLDYHARKKLHKSAYASLKAAIKSPQHVFNVGAAGLVAAFMAGNPDTNYTQTFTNHCMDNLSRVVQNFCAHMAQLETLGSEERVMAAALFDSFEGDEARINAIAAITQNSARTGMKLRPAIIISMLESSLNRNTSATTSSARGMFQYTQGTWVQSFLHHANAYAPGLMNVASTVKIRDGQIVGAQEQIDHVLALRGDLDLHAYIGMSDITKDHPELMRHDPAQQGPDDARVLAFALNMGNAYEMLMAIPSRMADLQRRDANLIDTQRHIQQAVAELEKHMIVRAYLDHFMGKTGAAQFVSLLENRNTKFDSARRHISNNVINANPGIFGENGERSIVDVYTEIFDRVDMAWGRIDKIVNAYSAEYAGRVDVAAERQLQVAPIPMERPSYEIRKPANDTPANAVDAIGELISKVSALESPFYAGDNAEILRQTANIVRRTTADDGPSLRMVG